MEMNASIDIDRPPEVVYGFVADPENDVQWRSGVTESGLTSAPPLALGSEGYAGTGNQVSHWRVTAISPGSSVDWDLIDGPFGGTGGYRLEPVEDGTRFTLRADVEPRGMMRLLGPLFARMGKKQNQADVARLKAILEAGP